ncbi:MAG TPA: hypothetical protein VF881_09945 [Polyangiaceae bacterium]
MSSELIDLCTGRVVLAAARWPNVPPLRKRRHPQVNSFMHIMRDLMSELLERN